MKKFTCKEIMNGEGGCDKVFEGETATDIAMKSSKHFMKSTDKVHKSMRDMMAKGPNKEEQKKWWDWFNKSGIKNERIYWKR